MATTFKAFLDKMGGTSATNYVGNEGELFYDPTTTTLRVSDGSTPGGTVVSSGGSGISNVVEDTTPQLGGNLDVNGKDIVSTGGGNIQIVASADGDVLLTASGSGVVSVTSYLSVGGDVLMDGNVVGVYRLQPQQNSMAEIYLPLDTDANTTPLTLYSEGAAGIKIEGRLQGAVDTVTAAATAPTLDLLTPVVVLNYTDTDQSYILPNGTFEGQIVYFLGIPASGSTYYHYTVNLLGTFRTTDNLDEIIVTSDGLWYPWGEQYSDGTGTTNFTPVNSVHASHAVFAIWAGNAWNVSRGTISYA